MTITLPMSIPSVASRGLLDRRRLWSPFRVFNLYRLILATVLLGIFFVDEQNRFAGRADPDLFLWTTVTYMAIVMLSIAASFRRRPALKVQALIQTLIDIVGLSLLIHASGGVVSNLTILLVTAIAASGILLSLYMALAAAALAFFLMVGEWLYTAFLSYTAIVETGLSDDWNYRFADHLQTYTSELGHLGILGASFFIAALITYTLAERARRSEALVQQRTQELLEMAELNRAIVQHLQSGVIVVDRFACIRLMNDTAHRLLDYPYPAQGLALDAVSPLLSQRLTAWLDSDLQNPRPFRQTEHLPEITVTFSHLRDKRAVDVLIALEDSTLAAQRLQQIKLAALGRMTAAIAHEIRNPLTSISHAAQLLQESATASDSDRRLGQIIHDNTRRADRIIASVLDLSRRSQPKPEAILLRDWLDEFGREFLRGYGATPPQLEVRVESADLTVQFDAGHLQQVLWNLCTNACSHGAVPGQVPRITLSAGLNSGHTTPFIEVRDYGPGILEADIKKIFEPFFTTKARGTGLGLYIAREICEANGTQLQYIKPPEAGSCFRIIFANAGYQEQVANGYVQRADR